MKTFLDKNITKTKTFILYGNLKDTFWGPDLMPRDIDHYLVKLLKSRGFEHIIFYGEDGTRGAYCIDAKSARFFFDENRSFSMPLSLDEVSETEAVDAGPEVSNESESGSIGNQVENALSGLLSFDEDEDDGMSPGDISGDSITTSTEGTGNMQGSMPSTNNFKVRYCRPELVLSEFLQIIHPLMLKADSRMAVIFYNALTTRLSSSSLRNDILSNWEQNSKGNICFLMAPETQYNETALENQIRQYGLESKFLQAVSTGFDLNPTNCFDICQPDVDEIKYMLRYLSIVGTTNGNIIKIKYRDLEKIATRIQFAVGKCSELSGYDSKKLGLLSLKEIYGKIERYIDVNSSNSSTLELRPETIDLIWNIQNDDGLALKELEKPGWEPAKKKIEEALAQYKKAQNGISSSKFNQNLCKKLEWGIERFSFDETIQDDERPSIPNFVILGNPGTGKSTIARKIGKILHDAGILKIGHTNEVTKEKLTNSYVAGVPRATMEQVNLAEEGVLFIDEAQLLGKKDGGVGHDGTGVEVVSTLNHAMTNPNHHFSVVLAGYEKEMQAVFDLDQGFKRRFGNNFIIIDDYSPELLTTILCNILKQRGYQLSPELISTTQKGDTSYIPVECMVKRIYEERDREKFGNAGTMKDLADYAAGKSAENITIDQSCFVGALDGAVNNDWFEPMDIGASIDAVQREMDDNFIGMKEAKATIKDIGLELEDYSERGVALDEMHLKPIILVGNPGVGKTSLAHLLPKMYYHYHVLGTSKPIIVNASTLADKYQGGTQEKILSYIKKAQDTKGFLFIDEAHELLNEHFDGKGAFKAFMAPTTDKDHPFLACFAVYPSRLKEFLAMDPGALSRFRIIHLEDYTGNELYEIMQRKLVSKGYVATGDTNNLLKQVLNRVYLTRDENTGNGRKVNNIIEDMDALRRQRCKKQGIAFSAKESLIFQPEDIPFDLRDGLQVDYSENSRDSIEDILKSFTETTIGMDNVKSELEDIAFEIQELKESGKSVEQMPLRPVIFSGNPGTGKTKLANMLPRIYAYFGILHDDVPIIVNASQLASRYQGGSQEIIRAKILEAQQRKACLYVDEAHELLNEHFDGKGAFKAFMAPTTDTSHPFLACFAVYPEKLADFLAIDPGAASRFRIIKLEDYSPTQLYEILLLKINDKGCYLSDQCQKLLKQLFERVYATRTEKTGNARYVERLLEDMDRERRQRCHMNNISFSTEESKMFVPEDIPYNLRKNLSISDDTSNIERYQRIKNEIATQRVAVEGLNRVLVGLIDSLIYQEKFPKRRKVVEPGHYFFKGSPGTGKTTGASYLANYLYELGLVQSPEPICISASHLVGQYLGETPTKTRERLQNSIGHVLMIDEAYALACNQHLAGSEYKQEAVNEIVNFLDNPVSRKTTCVIFAGYEHDMDALYDTNAGLKSRVTEIVFQDFSTEQAFSILCVMLENEQIHLSNEAESLCKNQIEQMRKCNDFANGRTIRRYAKLLSENLEQRCINHIDEYVGDDPRAYEILPGDIPELSVVLSTLNI